MWKTYRADDLESGLVGWHEPATTERSPAFYFDVRGGPFGIRMVRDESALGEVATEPLTAVQTHFPFAFQASDQDELPALGEQFVRGDELHLSYPQGQGVYGIRLVLKPIRTSEDLLVLESTVSIQTNLLDSHPTIDLVAPASKRHELLPASTEYSPDAVAGGVGSCAISVAIQDDATVALLLGPLDSPFTRDCSSNERLCLRLFGDFLEKGVIRRARPWIVIGRGAGSLQTAQLQGFWSELCESPVPLN